MAFLDSTVVNVALPKIGEDLHASTGQPPRPLCAGWCRYDVTLVLERQGRAGALRALCEGVVGLRHDVDSSRMPRRRARFARPLCK